MNEENNQMGDGEGTGSSLQDRRWEPIDLYRSGGMFRTLVVQYHQIRIPQPFVRQPELDIRDLNKIIHYARLLMGDVLDGEDNTL